MSYDFDRIIDRRQSDSIKWREYDAGVFPLWVADMDFPAPEPVLEALCQRVAHGVLGYGVEPPELRPVLMERLETRYGWRVPAEAIVFLPGVVVGFNLVCRATASTGEEVLVQTPIYPPVLSAPRHQGLIRRENRLAERGDGSYGIDFDAFEAAISGQTRTFILCNPHNPAGRVYTSDELARMADICLRHDMVICSDEIHCDFLYDGRRHIPIASLDPAIGQRTVTLMAPSKTYNVAGLHCAFAVIENEELRKRVLAAGSGLISGVDVFGFTAALAAYSHAQPWLDELLVYLQGNRDALVEYVREYLPGIKLSAPEGTYLAWLDCRSLVPAIAEPQRFFLEQAQVALGDGRHFGRDGAGFVRLNFGCPRSILMQALEQMRAVL